MAAIIEKCSHSSKNIPFSYLNSNDNLNHLCIIPTLVCTAWGDIMRTTVDLPDYSSVRQFNQDDCISDWSVESNSMFLGVTDLEVNFLRNGKFLYVVSHYEFRQIGIRTTHGAFTPSHILSLCATLPLQISHQDFFASRSVSVHGPAFLRNYWERSQNADMDCHIGLCLGCHCEKAAQYRSLALHNSTDFKPDSFLLPCIGCLENVFQRPAKVTTSMTYQSAKSKIRL